MPRSRFRHTKNENTASKTMGPKVNTQKTPETPESFGFKGFDKVPKVILERHNIAPYLKTSKPIIPTTDSLQSLIDKYPAFFVKSEVKLARCDLEKLKEAEKISATFRFRCKICEKRYPDEKKLRNHHDNKHLIVYGPFVTKLQKRVSFSDHVVVHEVTEYHKCRKCTKIFENYRLLKRHMKDNHKKRKCYICNYCTMSFVDRTIFKVHIKLHCDVCLKLFPNKSQYVEHRRLVCKVAKNSSRIIKLNIDLLDTNKIDVNENSCQLCNESFTNKCAMRHHKSFLHLNIRPEVLFETKNIGNECIYVCLFCEETFVDKDVAKKHVELLPDLSNKSVNGTNVFYHCNQCTKIFNIESELLSHKWSHILSNMAKEFSSDKAKDISYCKTNKVTHIGILNNSSENEKNTEKSILSSLLQKNANGKVKKADKIYKCSPRSISVTDLQKPLHDMTSDDIASLKKPIVNPMSKKTLLSRFQCEECCKFFSSGYTLRRHIEKLHTSQQYRCEHCEEYFVWPSLLESHQCLRNPLPELPFDDARPEILLFNQLNHIQPVQYSSEIDGVDIHSTEDNYLDFEIPTPIVDITEDSEVNNGLTNGGIEISNGFQSGGCVVNGGSRNGHVSELAGESVVNNNVSLNPAINKLQNLGYKVIMQEVPIEF